MRYTTIALLAAALTGCAHTTPIISSSAAGNVAPPIVAPSSTDMDAAYSANELSTEVRVSFIDQYVDAIDDRVPVGDLPLLSALNRVETILDMDAFADVTDEQFSRMETFLDGSKLVRLRMLPISPSAETETFFYNNGNLVAVRYQSNGADLPDPNSEGAETFYFGEEGLISWTKPDGKSVPSTDADFAYWSAQLLKEGERFARGER
jgi:hypothetical protein